MDDLKIDVYVLCKNEMKLAPFFVDYWKALSDNVRVYVYDGHSDDGTREYLSQFDFIEIRNKVDKLDDFEHIRIKNECWKESNADFVMVADFDETIFSYDVETLRKSLIKMKEDGYTILAPLSFNIICDAFPEYTNGKYLHELCEYGFNDYEWYTKPILFDPKEIKQTNYVLGAHTARPTGNVKWYNPDDLFLIHAKFIGLKFYIEEIRLRNVSSHNRKCGLDAETNKSDEQLTKDYGNNYTKRFSWFDIKDNFSTYYKKRKDWSKWGVR